MIKKTNFKDLFLLKNRPYKDKRGYFKELIKENKIKQSLGEGVSKSKELNHVASIPLVVVEQLAKQQIMSPNGDILDHVRFKKWLNDSDNRAFRVWTGTV